MATNDSNRPTPLRTDTPEEAWERQIAEEDAAIAALGESISWLVMRAAPLWHLGDGYGGWVMREVRETLGAKLGWEPQRGRRRAKKRAELPAAVRRAVYERDAYRCRTCATWLDLTVDHVVAESNGGSDELDNLQTLCLSCNCRKGAQ